MPAATSIAAATAIASLGYGIYSSEESRNQARQADQAATRKEQQASRDLKNQQLAEEDTVAQANIRSAQKTQAAKAAGISGTILGGSSSTSSSSSIGSGSGSTILGS